MRCRRRQGWNDVVAGEASDGGVKVAILSSSRSMLGLRERSRFGLWTGRRGENT